MQNSQAQTQDLQAQEAQKGPVEIDLQLLQQVSGGAPKSGWSAMLSDTNPAPKSGW